MAHQQVTLTQLTSEIDGGDHIETYRVNAKLARGLLALVDGDSVDVRTPGGAVFSDSKYALLSIEQDSCGRWIAVFIMEEEHYAEECMAGLIRADVALALRLTEDLVTINWRGL